jgi:hypothetical protein
MEKVDRASFEASLLAVFREKFQQEKHVKIKKDLTITMKMGSNLAEIKLVYVKWANGYYLIAYANSDYLSNFLTEYEVPYKSRILAKYDFCLTTLSEKVKVFASSANGHAEIPAQDKWVDGVSREIADKIGNIYIPYVENFLNMNLAVIDDIVARPDCYAFPFATALCAAKHNELSFDDFDYSLFLKNKLLGDVNFDGELIKKVLHKK